MYSSTTKHFKYLCIIALAVCGCKVAKQPADSANQNVSAQMYLKGNIGDAGFVECNAEGKRYGIKAVTEQTFYPDDDSFRSMHHHGFALENRWMAYRVYFDKRHTVDIYAKRKPGMEIAKSLWYPNDEQLAMGFGDDVLMVSGSIGVGSVRPYDKNKQRLLPMDRFSSRTQRIVSVDKQKAVAEVEVQGLQVEKKTTNLTTRYTAYADKRGLLCEVFATDSLLTLATGVQYVGEPLCIKDTIKNNIVLASWGTSWPVNDTVKYGKETVGLAVKVPQEYVSEVINDKQQELAILRLKPTNQAGKQLYYCRFWLTAMGLKEDTPPANNSQEFFRLVRKNKIW